MTDDFVIPEEALTAATKALAEAVCTCPKGRNQYGGWYTPQPTCPACGDSETKAKVALAAALPHLRAHQTEGSRDALIADLRFLAEARKDYCARCPETQNEMRDMGPTELGVHDGHATASWLADILEGTNDAKGWLPSWRWDEWAEGGLVRLAIPNKASPTEAETKALAETATKLGYELGRKETAEAIAEAIEALDGPMTGENTTSDYLALAAQIARDAAKGTS